MGKNIYKNIIYSLFVVFALDSTAQNCDTTIGGVSYNYVEKDSLGRNIRLANYRNNLLTGNAVIFEEMLFISLGTLIPVRSEGKYRKSKKEGIWNTFDEKGNIISTGEYRKDTKVGRWCYLYGFTFIVYNRNGKQKSKARGNGCGCDCKDGF